MFPIETHYRPPRQGDRLEASISRTVRDALSAHDGDVLVFLPGAAEQRRVASRLSASHLPPDVRVHQLHGAMPLAAQDAALALAPSGTRKVVLATSVAETSLTIEGVRVVVDSGLSRLPRYEPRLGLTRLETVRVSRASADQRRGRAGRTAPGACYRVWDQHEEFGFQPRTRPEILDADLSSLALELADAGVHEPGALRWLDVPRAGPFAGARELLAQLGALGTDGRITAHGKRMAALPLQPRLAHLLLEARARGQSALGAEIAALLEERDIMRSDAGPAPSDLRLRVEALRRDGDSAFVSVDRDAAERVRHASRELSRRLSQDRHVSSTARGDASTGDVHETGALLALAFPDRVARRRTGTEPRFLLRNGAGASLARHDALADSAWLAIAELDGTPPEYRILRAAPMTDEDVRRDFETQFTDVESVEWHEATRSVRGTRRTMLGTIVVGETVVQQPDPELVSAAMLAQIAREGIDALPLGNAASAVRQRMAFVHAHDASWPAVSHADLIAAADRWLVPRIDGIRRWSDLSRVDWSDALLSLLPWERRAALDRLAPTHLEVPSGSRIGLDYSVAESPVLAVKLQEVFGWTSTPMLLDGRVPVTMHLLSPAQRPVQVTRDLAGFWRTSYFEVRKEMRGRYPRHPWPDDPLTAPPTRRAKPRGT